MKPPPAETELETRGEAMDISSAGFTAESAFRTRKLCRHLRHFWWVPLLTLLLFVTGATAYILERVPTYVSQASLWETEKIHLPESALISEDPQNYLGNQTELLKSGKLQRLTVESLETGRTNRIPRDNQGRPPKVKVSVREAPKSSVVVVEASGAEPEYVQAYLDGLLSQYIQFKKELRKLVSGDTQASVSEQVLRLDHELKADQDALMAFERTNNLAILQEEGAAAGGYLVKLQTQLSDYQFESRLLEPAVPAAGSPGEQATNFAGGWMAPSYESQTGLPAVPTWVQTAGQQLDTLKIQHQRLSQSLRPKHPKMIKLEEAIEEAQTLLDLYATQSREQLVAVRQSLKLKCDNLQVLIQEWQGKVVAANARIAEADHLKLNVNRTQNLYDRLVGLLQSVDLSRNIDQDALAILQPASPAQRTYGIELLVLILAVMGGVAAGLGLVFLRTLRDDRFTSICEVDASLESRIVGLLPEMQWEQGGALSLLESNDSRSMYAESYRSLRSALLHLPVAGERPKVILITSAIPSEGKSTIAANLAGTLAWGGSRVLLVDANLRKSHLHELLGQPGEPGLIELLRQPGSMNRVIQPGSAQPFAFLSRGNGAGHTSDLFLGPAFDEVLERMRQQFDHVLIDSSPIFVADDASTLAPKVDGTLFVVRGNYSSARLVREGLERLHQRQSRILGLVFNRADVSAHSYHYYNYAGGEEPKNKRDAGGPKRRP
jgi:capsular exopolysaccharide synthesis family protein